MSMFAILAASGQLLVELVERSYAQSLAFRDPFALRQFVGDEIYKVEYGLCDGRDDRKSSWESLHVGSRI